MTTNKVSVITPNKAGREMVTDLEDQTFTDFEHIIIKDMELKGQSWALNQGIKKAKGEYYMFLDDDLHVEDTLLEDLFNALDGTEHSLAYCGFRLAGRLRGYIPGGEWDVERLKKSNYISNCSMVRAKDFTEWDESIFRFKDWDAWLTMAENGHTGVWVNKTLFTAYYFEDGISTHPDKSGEAAKIIQRKHGLI